MSHSNRRNPRSISLTPRRRNSLPSRVSGGNGSKGTTSWLRSCTPTPRPSSRHLHLAGPALFYDFEVTDEDATVGIVRAAASRPYPPRSSRSSSAPALASRRRDSRREGGCPKEHKRAKITDSLLALLLSEDRRRGRLPPGAQDGHPGDHRRSNGQPIVISAPTRPRGARRTPTTARSSPRLRRSDGGAGRGTRRSSSS